MESDDFKKGYAAGRKELLQELLTYKPKLDTENFHIWYADFKNIDYVKAGFGECILYYREKINEFLMNFYDVSSCCGAPITEISHDEDGHSDGYICSRCDNSCEAVSR